MVDRLVVGDGDCVSFVDLGLLQACEILVLSNTTPREDHGMSRTTTMTVRLGGTLRDFVSTNVGENGSYENVSEYIRDLIRRDKERSEREAFDRLKAELARAFAAPDESFHPLSDADVIARNREDS